jgi:hypothetical protein
MKLEKLYLDVVADDGAGLICYAVDSALGGLAFHPASLLAWGADHERAAVRHWVLNGRTRAKLDPAHGWHCPGLGLAFAWPPGPAAAPWREQLLWDSGGTRVRWKVIVPRSFVEVCDSAGNRRLAGHGYAERLSIEGSLRALPIDVLHWGRFVSATHNVTWIEWAHHGGGRRWLWHDSDTPQTSGIHIGAESVSWPGHHLELRNWRTLRHGMIGGTVFGRAGRFQRLLPAWIRAVDERKWLARGTLSMPDGSVDEAWVIHETVVLRHPKKTTKAR